MFSVWILGNCQDVLIWGYQAAENKGVSAHYQCFPWNLVFTLVVSISLESFSSFPFRSSKIVPSVTHVHSLWFQSLPTVLLMWTLSVKWSLSLITLQLVGNYLLKSYILIKPIAESFGIIATNPTKLQTKLDFLSLFLS